MSFIKRHIYCKRIAAAWASVFCLFLLFPPGKTRAQEDSLQYISGQTTFFCGMNYSLQWRQGDLPDRQSGALLFVIYHANHAVVKIPVVPSGKPSASASDRGVFFQVDFQYPELKPGIAIETKAAILAQKKDDSWVKVFQSPFYFFSRQFVTEHLANVPEDQIGIIDRSNQQTFIRLMQGTGISFSRVSSIHDFRGKWLICSGLDFKGTPSLFSELLGLAKKGVSIAVFPPCTGTFPVPAYQPGLQVRWGDQRFAQTIDPRLNLIGCEKEFQNPAVFFQLENSGQGIAVQCSRKTAGFHWLELSFEQGTLLFCGWDVGGMFSKNPSARLLLSKILNQRSTEAHDEQN